MKTKQPKKLSLAKETIQDLKVKTTIKTGMPGRTGNSCCDMGTCGTA